MSDVEWDGIPNRRSSISKGLQQQSSSPKAILVLFSQTNYSSFCMNINKRNLVNNGDTSCGSVFRVLSVLFAYDNVVTYLRSVSSICSVSST